MCNGGIRLRSAGANRKSSKGMIAGVLALACSCLAGTTVTAQLPDPEEDPDNCADLSVNGYWAGFWNLGPQINDQPAPELPTWGEITHAAVLAPPNDRYLLLWAERDVDCSTFDEQYETWMFNWLHPNRPIRRIVVPQAANEIGRTDLFCGGHSFGEDGQVISYGGTDFVEQCQQGDGRFGNDRVWTFDNFALTSTSEPAWHDGGPASPMEDVRWYPSAVELGNGDQLVLGDFECATCSHQASITRQRGRTVNTATWEFGWDPTTNNFFNSVKGNIAPT